MEGGLQLLLFLFPADKDFPVKRIVGEGWRLYRGFFSRLSRFDRFKRFQDDLR